MRRAITLWVAAAAAMFAQAPASKQVDVFGQKIHYLEAGSGPVVILLHGLGADATNWAMNTAVLAKSYHVYVPDQIGFGESDKPAINYRVGTLVDFLDGFYKKLGITKATVVGNSLGGWTAMAFTLAHPDKVDRMVVGGDELVGLMRGLLFAGAQGILVSLWDVHDQGTAEFMTAFYRRLQAAQNKADALQAAMKEVREKQPHPYYWAPFILVGKYL